jgi:hypothetical protein
LFIKEEQRHAALLERFLRREQTDVIEREWTNGVFRHLRNGMGLELMLSILLAAELMARVYYAALSRATEDPVLRTICRHILRDERWHVQFQCDRLRLMRTGRRGGARLAVRWAERIGFRAVCCAVWLDHAPAFRAAGIGFRAFWRKTGRQLEIARRLINSMPGFPTATQPANAVAPAASRNRRFATTKRVSQ